MGLREDRWNVWHYWNYNIFWAKVAYMIEFLMIIRINHCIGGWFEGLKGLGDDRAKNIYDYLYEIWIWLFQGFKYCPNYNVIIGHNKAKHII